MKAVLYHEKEKARGAFGSVSCNFADLAILEQEALVILNRRDLQVKKRQRK